jgi:hypothetical protein
MAKKDTSDAVPAAEVLRELAEVQHADQLEALRQNDSDKPPQAWDFQELSV